ncbi:MAG: hypothetical protein V7647_660 [Acidobacteriota bacterium]|jgi:DNA-binding CsgD family transcriptional regulator
MVEGLTQRERDCLRLVARGQSSKEIAIELGISHHTVDLHLRRAMRALGKNTRRDAARALAELEAPSGLEGIQLLSTHSPDIATGDGEVSLMAVRTTKAGSAFRVPFLRQGKNLNDLTPLARLLWIPVIAIILLAVIANFFNALGALWTITG